MPPVGEHEAFPSHDVVHEVLVALGLADSGGGWLMVTVLLAVHPFASVTVTMYEPAHRPVAVWLVCTGTVFHE